MKGKPHEDITQSCVRSHLRIVDKSRWIGSLRSLCHLSREHRLTRTGNSNSLDSCPGPTRRKTICQVGPRDMVFARRRNVLDRDHMRPDISQLQFKFGIVEKTPRLLRDIDYESTQIAKERVFDDRTLKSMLLLEPILD